MRVVARVRPTRRPGSGSSPCGTLGSLAPAASRVHRSLDDVFERMDRIHCAAELKPLVATLPSGLHLIASPPALRAADALTPEHHTVLTDFLSRFYDVILFDLGTGMTGPVTRSALAQADQAMVVSTPDFVTAATVLGALHQLPTERLTMVLNQAPRLPDARDRADIEHELRGQGIQQHVVVPDDELLRRMLDSATYDLAALEGATRTSIKRLGCCAARWLL